jgi:hydrogenase maturation protease
MIGEGGSWQEIGMRAPRTTVTGGVEIGRGSRVVLRPGPGADVFDVALAGRVGIVDRLDQDLEGNLQVAVTVEDDPGRDLGEARQPGHRFFFSLDEVEPLAAPGQPAPARARVLVAGIGNVFLGDDGFGVEVAPRLVTPETPPGVDVADFGIRGMDLVYALGEDYDAAVFVDAVPRGEEPGTLYVIEPDVDDDELSLDTHGMDPVKVLRLARELGPVPERLLVVGCEPLTRLSGDTTDELVGELSEPVATAVDEAAGLVESLLGEVIESIEEQRGKVTD